MYFPGLDKWVPVHTTKELCHTVKGLKEGQEYYFRVQAKNNNGFGEPKEVISSVKVQDQLGDTFLAYYVPTIIVSKPLLLIPALPTIELSEDTGKSVYVKAGQPIKLNLNITGLPLPVANWTKDGADIKEDLHRISTKTTSKQASLEIREATVEDRGDYRLTLTNSSGSSTQLIQVVILGRRNVLNHLSQVLMLEIF